MLSDGAMNAAPQALSRHLVPGNGGQDVNAEGTADGAPSEDGLASKYSEDGVKNHGLSELADDSERLSRDLEMSPDGIDDGSYDLPGLYQGARICRVTGCGIDVSHGKTFNARYRICEVHRRSPSLVVDGRRQRFCQMCAKFHELTEFEGSKMSCQVKLAEHNLRRRVNSGAKRRQYDYEGDLVPGMSPPAHVAVAGGYPPMGQPPAYHSGYPSFGGGSMPPTVQFHNNTVTPLHAAQHALRVAPNAQSIVRAAQQHHYMAQLQGIGYTVSQPQYAPSVGPGISLPPPMPQPAPPPALLANGTSGLHQQPAPNSERPAVLDLITMLRSMAQSRNPAAVAQLEAAIKNISPPSASTPPAPAPPADGLASALADAVTATTTAIAAAPPAVQPPILSADQSEQTTESREERFTRVSIKLFDCEPEHLAPYVHQEIQNLLDVDPQQMEAYVRPGCTHITLDIRTSEANKDQASISAAAVTKAAQSILATMGTGGGGEKKGVAEDGGAETFQKSPFLVQLGNEVVMGAGVDGPVAVFDLGAGCKATPELLMCVPPCVVAGSRQEVTLLGHRISDASDLPLCRQRGQNVSLDVLGAEHRGMDNNKINKDGSNKVGIEAVVVRPLGLVPGCAEFEVERGSLLSEAVPLLVVPNTSQGCAVAAEMGSAAAGRFGSAFIRHVGLHVDCLDQLGNGEGKDDGVKGNKVSKEVNILAGVAMKEGLPALAALLKAMGGGLAPGPSSK